MSKLYIGKQAESLSISPQLDAYKGVIVTAGTTTNADGDTIPVQYTAGDVSGNTGRVLEVECPWGTQGMADTILASIRNYAYQPLEAANSLLEPTAELGDSVMVNGYIGMVAKQDLTFSRLMQSNVAAPHDEEIDHEYQYMSGSEEHKTQRQLASKLDASGGLSQSCSWELTPASWTVKVNNRDIFTIDSHGAYIRGDLDLTGTFTIGGDEYSASDFRNLTRTCDNENGNWSSAYSSTSPGGYCNGGAGHGYTYDNHMIDGHYQGHIDATTLAIYDGGYYHSTGSAYIEGYKVVAFG